MKRRNSSRVKRRGEQCKEERRVAMRRREENITKKRALMGKRDKKQGLSWSLGPILF
jgi:hypothetical protein